ncbi:MAG: uracil-DNA glycosylase [Bacteroidales bacterium]
MEVKIESTWKRVLEDEFSKPYFEQLTAFVKNEYATKKIFPKGSDIFNAFDLTPFDQVKVVILGQDPYHEPDQAHGLCFSVQEGVKFPPSLQNIFKELVAETGFSIPESGNLSSWARQGVLLLNATLTVEAHKAGSHQNKGWEQFTDAVIHKLAESRDGIVFILWGAYAQRKGAFIDTTRHCVLKSAHPSPLSAYRGFFGNNHFGKANEYLKQRGVIPVDWQL